MKNTLPTRNPLVKFLLSIMSPCLLLAAAPVAAQSLTTAFNADNSFAGNTFDIEVGPNPIQITRWDVNLDNIGSTETVTIYWRNGTSEGFGNSPAGWNVMGSDTNVVSAGADNPSPVNISGPVFLPGQTYGIYVDLESFNGNTAMLYTNGGPSNFSNADLSLTTFTGRGDPAFTGGEFRPRIWNGTIYYRFGELPAVPVMENWQPIAIAILLIGIMGLMHTQIRTR